MRDDSEGRHREVLQGLEPLVRENLKFLTTVDTKRWWPAQFFSFMEQEDYQNHLSALREQAKGLDDELLIVLVGDMVTEEALPNYSAGLASLFPDRTGVDTSPWSLWQRGWNAEEEAHGRVGNRYLLLTGRVNMIAVDRSIYSLIKAGFKQSPRLYKSIFYPAFQEPATRVSHFNVAQKAREQGDETLSAMCSKIAGDENRHAQFYLNVGRGIIDADPEGAIVEFYELMREGIVMPAHLMTDGIYTEPPTLFDHFKNVAQWIKVYTAFDYADILESLNDGFAIAHRSVNGEAAVAQEYLLKLPDRFRRVGEWKAKMKKPDVPFDWLYGRAV